MDGWGILQKEEQMYWSLFWGMNSEKEDIKMKSNWTW